MRRLPPPKKKKQHDPGLMAAVQMASYQMQVRKQAIKELTINEEVDKLCDRHIMDVEDQFTDWLYGAFALALHRKFGFGAKRIADVFSLTQDIKNELLDSGIGHLAVWDLVAEETGLTMQTHDVKEIKGNDT